MDKKRRCPICERACPTMEEFNYMDGDIPTVSFDCEPIGRTFYLDWRIIGMYEPKEQLFYTAIVNDLLGRKYSDRRFPHYCYNTVPKSESENDVYIDVNDMPLWDLGHVEKVDQSLLNLYRMYREKAFELGTGLSMRSMLCTDKEHAQSMASSLLDFGYITESTLKNQSGRYIISKEGWKRIDELRRHHTDRTGFVAMAFREETNEIRDVLKESITKCGFKPIVIDEVEHNNQIVPEIERNIQRCRFLVMDCSVPNMGAYFEAGMAAGFGKEVIICCNEESFQDENIRPHFDVRQKSMIIWKNLDDLKNRLVKRILCTVEGAQIKEETDLNDMDSNNR